MFEGWGNFYFLLGSASASLIGLMFVVTTLTRGRDRSKVERGQRLFMTPTVFNFAAVLTLSAMALTPKLAHGVHEAVLAMGAAYGLGYALVIGVQSARLWRESKSTVFWSDVWCYGLIPPIVYIALESSILATGVDHDLACDAVALSLLALLLIAVRNAWDLVTWMAPMANGIERPPPTTD
jgi:hypothetical protein